MKTKFCLGFQMIDVPQSINCLRINLELFKQLQTCTSFSDPLDTLRFALSQSADEGIALEFGVYSGRTLQLIADRFPNKTFGFDSFDGLPEDWREGFPAGTFSTLNVPEIEGTACIKGLFQETLDGFIARMLDEGLTELSFIHLDADLYSSSKFCLNKLNDFIKPGCVIVFDEFMNYPGFENHEYLAYTEWSLEFERVCAPIAFTDWHQQMAFIVER